MREPSPVLPRWLPSIVQFLILSILAYLPSIVTRVVSVALSIVDRWLSPQHAPTKTATPSAGQLALLRETNEVMSTETDIEVIYAHLRQAVLKLLPVERAAVLVLQEHAGVLRLVSSSHADVVVVPEDNGIASAALSSGRAVVIADVSKDPRYDPSNDASTGLRTCNVLAVPVLTSRNAKATAVLQAFNKSIDGQTVPFDDSDVALLEVRAPLRG